MFHSNSNGRRYSIVALLLAGVSSAACSERATSPGLADPMQATLAASDEPAVLGWSALARQMIVRHKPVQQAAFRGFAYLTLAQHSSVEAVSRADDTTRASVRGAVAGASAGVLTYLYPTDSARFAARVRAEESSLPAGERAAFRAGQAIGREYAARAVSRARRDEFNATWRGTVPVGPGIWFSSAVPPAPPSLPLLGKMRPFYLRTGKEFRPGPPPAFGSPAFASALGEVRQTSDTRTPAQDSIAQFWAMATGTLIAGFWNTTAADLIMQQKLGERDAAHALAVMYAASMDGLIACADAKFAYWLLRPTQADTAITLAIGLPNFPSYPSNHACVSGVAAYVLAELFPAERERLEQMAEDAGISRVYGGIHYRFDSDTGLTIARNVTAKALRADRRGVTLTLLR